ncbi:glycosyltransferase [Naasia sp. SYSU D00948]|uniref:glycosyltransferase n=1 Tax=Naasia sp. SYSU D00948 TaxID=2817379 RepID=UPI001B302A22|nr:glycosyltransferase [Naasia sp. SYSU D00948]
MSDAARTAVIVVNFGMPTLLERNFAALDLEAAGARLIVVDNRRTPEESAAVARLGARHGWTVLLNEDNAGFGAGVNRGAAAAIGLGCDVLVLANPDLALPADVLRELAADCRRDPVVVVSPRILREDGSTWFSGGTILVDEGRASTAPSRRSEDARGWLSGACLAVHADLWRKAGGFDERYFLYWEDVDLSWRLVAAGGRLRVRRDLEVVHSVGGTQEGSGKSPTYVYWNCRNRLLFAAAHLSEAERRRWERQSIRYARSVLLRGGRRQLLRRFVPLTSAALRGTLAGLRISRASRGAPSPERPLTVLQSLPVGSRETNPYLLQLLDSLSDSARVLRFSWRRALVGKYDVFHVHWPERLIRGHSRLKTAARRALFLALLIRLRLARTAVVRTVHNLRSHEEGGRVEQWLLRALERRTSAFIRLNPYTPVPPGALARTIKHGDYRQWYSSYPRPERVPGRLLFFGLVRPYKGVTELLGAFGDLRDSALRLHVVGKPGTSADEAAVRSATSDDRVDLRLGYADDADLAREVGEAELVVLPYRNVHNSGAAILALSLDRPVLMPRADVVDWLRDEVGSSWVLTYDPPLTSEALAQALSEVRRAGAVRCVLQDRDWPMIGREHVDLYREVRR